MTRSATRPPAGDLLAALREGSASLSQAQRQVVAAILDDPEFALRANVDALAKRAHVSPPTITRFCHALGYAGLREFKLRLADEGIIDGFLPAPILVEALHQQVLALELGSEIISSLSRLMSFVEGPENLLPYEIYGTVTLDRTVRDPFRFNARGETPLVLADQR